MNCHLFLGRRILAVSRTLHSSKPNTLCGSELIVDHKTQTQNW